MLFYFEIPSLTFTDPETGATLSLLGDIEGNEVKGIEFSLIDKEGRGSKVKVSSKKDLQRICNYIKGKTADPSTAPTYRRTDVGVYLFWGEGEPSHFDTMHQLNSVLDGDYHSLNECFPGHPDAIVLFYWYDGSIGRDAIKSVIQHCVEYQREFILTGDPMKCRRMTLETISQQTGVNIATVSRCANKDVRIFTPHKTFTLDNHSCDLETPSLFDEGILRNNEYVSRLEVMAVIRDMIMKEDKKAPYSDETIAEILKKMGYQIQRRTVAKYREYMMNIPSSARRRWN